MRKITIAIAFAALVACAKKTVPEGNVKGISKFQLGGGAAISQPGVDEYNPYVLQTGDNFLVLVFGSNRSCGGCTGHNLFIARSTTAYNNDAVFPAFDNPTVMTISGTPLNYATPIAFAPTLSGNNIRVFLTNAGGTVQQTGTMPPGGPYDPTTLTTIANTAGQNSTVVGIEFTGTKLYTRLNGTVYSFNHASAADPLVAMATGQTAASLASVDGAFTSRYDGFFSLVDGTIAGMSLYGMGGNVEKVNTAIAKARLSARFMTLMRGGGFKGGLMFISGIESGGTTQDLYVVDGMTVWQMWEALSPKPPGAPDSGSTPAPTTTANPAFSPVAGIYASMINLTITSTTTGATICYTTNGVDPVCDSTPACTTGTQYSTAVALGYFTGTAKAIACKSGLTNSAIVSAAYISDIVQPTAPTGTSATPNGSNQIDLAWTAGSDAVTTTPNLVYEICRTTTSGNCAFATFSATYTTTAGATAFSATGLSAATTYYFTMRTRDEAGNTSGVPAQFSATTAAGPSVSAPSFSPVAGTFNSAQNVNITTSTGSSILCYSTDGSTPACDATPSCTTGNLYSSAVNIAATATLRAIGCRNGYSNSSVTAGTYTIDTTAPTITATAPASSANVSNTQVSFTFSEACASGNVTWTRTGGTADGASPHVKALAGAELNVGAHNSITLTNNPTLVSGTIYDVAFNCTDAAGNAAATVTNTSVTYNPSAGGSVWTARTMPSAAEWQSVTYGNGVFVAVAQLTSNKAATSPDGINWTARTLPSAANWYSVTYGNGIFVAINLNGGAASSPDGITWTARTMPPTYQWFSVAYGNGVFVAVADNNNIAATSPDGITWTQRFLSTTGYWRSVTYGNNLFVSVAWNNSTTATTSPDGITWTTRTLPTASNWVGVTYGNGTFVAVSGGTAAATSTNGITWTARTLPNNAAAVAYGNGVFVTMSSSGGTAASSTDGITWTARTMPSSAQWTSGAYGNGIFAAVSSGPSNAAASSPNPDTTAPVISSVTPGGSTTVSNAKVSYTLSEDCSSGSITWTRTGGTPDAGSPRVQALTSGELAAGSHNNITLTNNPALVAGAVYTLTFNATDPASIAATTVTVTNVTYQTAATGWYTFIGSNNSENAYAMQQTSDGGYITAGTTSGAIPTLGGQTALNAWTAGNDMLIIKTTSAGAVSWYTMIGSSGTDNAYSIVQTSDGGYIVAGVAGANIATLGGQSPLIAYGSGNDMLVVKLTSAGAVSWYTFLGGANGQTAYSIQQTSDGGYIVAGDSFFNLATLGGQTPLNAWNSGQDWLIVKLTSAGAVSWYTFLGSTSSDQLNSIIQTSDSGYLIGGSANAAIATLGGQSPLIAYGAGTDSMIVKLTSAGAVSWFTFSGGAAGNDAINAVKQTSDGGYIAAGYASVNIASMGGKTPLNAISAVNDMMVIKMTAAGAISWYTFLGGGGNDSAYGIAQTSDDGFVVTGDASANFTSLAGQTPVYSYTGGTDGLMVKLTSAGTVAWYSFIGTAGTDRLTIPVATSDGHIAIFGYMSGNIPSIGGQTPLNAFSSNSDPFLIKLKADGGM